MNKIWYGSEESYFTLVQAEEKMTVLLAQGPEAIKAAVLANGGGRGADPFAMPSMVQMDGNLAIVHVSGSLIEGSAGFMRLFGVVGYHDIQDALAQVANDPKAKSVLLSIDSGGGQVTGLDDAGNSVQALDAIKPVHAHTGSNMGSAAYWLGASARSVSASRMANVGSVGTLIVHTERSKQLADSGVKATVIRYGEFKALANPIEPLSEAGRKELQAMADASGKMFVSYVADRRKMSAPEFQAKAGEGRVFMGDAAKSVGLIDAVMGQQAAVNFAKSLDNTSAQQHNSRNSGKGLKMKLSKKTILAIAAGTTLDQLGLSTDAAANLEGVKLEGDALVVAESEAREVQAAINVAVATATSAATAKAVTLEASIADLTGKLTAAESAKATFEAASNDFKGKLETSSKIAADMTPILRKSLSVMTVAMGGAADVGASLTGPELVAEHEKVALQFTARFPAGGVAAVTGKPAETSASKDVPSARFLTLVNTLKSS